MLEKSRYNILFDLKNKSGKMIANSLYGNADVLTPEEVEQYENGDFSDKIWQERGYAVIPQQEKQAFQKQYVDFLDDRETDEIQLFFVPTYACNFGCDYCYQHEYTSSSSKLSTETIDAFFVYAAKQFAGRRKYVTLFGGEPLLPSAHHQEHIAYFLSEAEKQNLDTAIVTNGYHLTTYLPMLSKSRIREVQVTLDGMEEVHNQRRPLKNGAGTFNEIVEGIDQLIAAKIPVNLRMVMDSSNMEELPKLARFAIDRGWTKTANFKTQLGRNYELHSCQKNQKVLYSRVQMYAELAEVIENHPHILEFHKPSFHFIKTLSESGTLPAAIFDSCPGCKTEWAFDYQGKIYSCTATVGKSNETLGTFYPTVTLNDDDVELWQERDILAIEKCKTCNLALVCGGGCGSVAKNQHGSLDTTDCRPVQELAGIGASVYFDENGDAKRIR